MIQIIQSSLLWFSAIGCAVIGGVYFAFSTFIMTAFATLDRAAGIAAMQAINDVILRSLFMPLFFGTTLASLILAGLAIVRWSVPGSRLILIAACLYVAGMFLVTVIFNVPLNNGLAAKAAATAEAASVWTDYLRTWTFWNHVRTATSIAAGVIYVVVLARG
jgi:uncharacterized membrane protein